MILGRGGAGKSTLAREIAAATRLPLIELDAHFWSADLTPMDGERWRDVQAGLAAADAWIMDGDLGPYDDPEPRLARADQVVVLDYPLRICVARALRRGRERADFWVWVVFWRLRSRPRVRAAIARWAPRAVVTVLRHPRDAAAWVHRARAG